LISSFGNGELFIITSSQPAPPREKGEKGESETKKGRKENPVTRTKAAAEVTVKRKSI